jgi:DnaJ-class molecular chaperone
MKTMAQDYYQLLEISRNASADEIQKSYRRLARKYHPDLNPDDKSAQQKFKEIQHAYDILSDPEKRQQYDQFGPDFERMGSGGSPFRGAGGGTPDFENIFGGGGPGGFQFEGDIGDIFRQFTGGGGPRGRGRRPDAPLKGQDVTAELTIPFNTAVVGGRASISARRNGQTESIQLKIPPGVETGRKLRLRGQGEPSPNGGQPGDLFVKLTVAPHPHFRRNGKDLELRLPITLAEAMLGASIEIPTPNGKVELKIPPGSSSGRRLRVRGQGGLAEFGPPGDLFVELHVKLPENLDSSQQNSEELHRAVQTIQQLYGADSPRSQLVW